MSIAIIVGNLHGFRTGEWKEASKQSRTWIAAGIGILILGVCILATGNGMAPGEEEPPKETTSINAPQTIEASL